MAFGAKPLGPLTVQQEKEECETLSPGGKGGHKKPKNPQEAKRR